MFRYDRHAISNSLYCLQTQFKPLTSCEENTYKESECYESEQVERYEKEEKWRVDVTHDAMVMLCLIRHVMWRVYLHDCRDNDSGDEVRKIVVDEPHGPLKPRANSRQIKEHLKHNGLTQSDIPLKGNRTYFSLAYNCHNSNTN